LASQLSSKWPASPRDRRKQVPVCIQWIDFEVFRSADYASLSQAVDHLRIPVAANVGIAGGAANRLLPLVLVAAEQEIVIPSSVTMRRVPTSVDEAVY